MAAYMVALTDMHDPAWLEPYVAAVPALIAKHGGEYVANGMGPQLLEGVMDVPDALTEQCGRALYNAFSHFTGLSREESKRLVLLDRVDVAQYRRNLAHG